MAMSQGAATLPRLMTYNPWRDLRSRTRVVLMWRDLPDSAGGAYSIPDENGGGVVVLSRHLDRVERREHLTHELVHLERGGGAHHPGMPPSWRTRVAVDELQVRREAAARLVPTDLLAAFCDRMADLGEGVGPVEVMDEFDCTRRVAEDALDNLKRHERGNP